MTQIYKESQYFVPKSTEEREYLIFYTNFEL